jgi:uncharacterized protein
MTDRRAGRCAIAIMAKAPRHGEVKTRLVPPLSSAEAAALGAAFLRDAAGNILAAAEAAPVDGWVAHSPPDAGDLFAVLLPPAISQLPSRRAGLGNSLVDAVGDLLALGYGAVCLVNADSPTLPTQYLIDAARILAKPGDRAVLGPAEDGGYYLIGLKRPHRHLFEEIAWSTDQVFRQTVARADEIGLVVTALPAWYDVDDVAALRRLAAELADPAGAGDAAPHTREVLRRLAARL